ncbi:CPK2 [Symbiodinium natans]|uniref:CPK2 protein n=1 Tax=Symbiodinium natans TaxID=878477 RepID=A0A812PD74_9DINO|nr:CPK2 [Symbiodinium natans]
MFHVEPGCSCWSWRKMSGLTPLGCLKGLLNDPDSPRIQTRQLLPNLIRQARSRSMRFVEGFVPNFIDQGRIVYDAKVEDRYIFVPGDPLGKGSFGEVKAATDRYTRERHAVKCAVIAKEELAEAFVQEAEMHLKLDHPNVCKLLQVYVSDGACHLVMELCAGGELYDRWADKGYFTEDEAIGAVRQMLRALTYLHWHHVCHRDLKLENWVYKDNCVDSTLKLIDFGFAKQFSEETPMTALLGTIYYIAPEVIRGNYSNKCDVWSLGVIVYMLLGGEPPFYDSHCDDWTMQKILHEPLDVYGPNWDDVSEDAKSFVSQLLDRDVSARPAAREASRHEWLQEQPQPGPGGYIRQGSSELISPKILEDLRAFASMNAMKRATFGLIAFSMAGDTDISDLEYEFRKLDKGGSGTILKSELAFAFEKQLGMSAQDANVLFDKLDITGDHEIEYSEFMAAVGGSRYMCNEALIKQAFKRLDRDGSGVISVEDLREVFGDNFNGTKVEDILQQVDYKHSGVIDYDEFVQAIMELGPDGDPTSCEKEGDNLRKRISRAYEFTSVGRKSKKGRKKIPKKPGMIYKPSQRFHAVRTAQHGHQHGMPRALNRGWRTPDISRHPSREFSGDEKDFTRQISLDSAEQSPDHGHHGFRPPALNRGWHTPDISRHPSQDSCSGDVIDYSASLPVCAEMLRNANTM